MKKAILLTSFIGLAACSLSVNDSNPTTASVSSYKISNSQLQIQGSGIEGVSSVKINSTPVSIASRSTGLLLTSLPTTLTLPATLALALGGGESAYALNTLSLLQVDGSGWFTSQGTPASGTGVEIDYDTGSDKGEISSHTSAGGYKSLAIDGNPVLINVNSAASVGIQTSNPVATLDLSGSTTSTIRLLKHAAIPHACDVGHEGEIALTHNFTICICNGAGGAWVQSKDGSTACNW